MNTSTPTRSTPLWRRAFILDTGKVYEGCKTRRTSQLADDCHLIAEEFLHFHALRGKEDFILHHRAIALDLRVSEGRVRKAINRLSQAGVIVLTKRQSLGHSSQWKVNPDFAHKQETNSLQQELREATRGAQRDVLKRHRPSIKAF